MGKLQVVGLVEKIDIKGKRNVSTYAVFDTGARSTSVDIKIASKAGLGPITRTIQIKNPSVRGKIRRPVVKAYVNIKGKGFDTEVNIQDRSHMNFPIIIGRDIISGNFVVDPEKNARLFKEKGRDAR